jgi:two-component system CheB/CheR fusion protein
MPQPTILNVDDDAAVRYVRTRVLEQAGFGVTEAATGGEALRLAANLPNLILLDVHLPDLDGLEVCRRLKSDPATQFIPVLHVSATAREMIDRVRGLDGGADSYLTEPVEPEVLVATARALLRAHEAEEGIRLAAQQWQATFDAINDGLALVDRDGVILRCNRSLVRILDLPASVIIGQRCFEIAKSVFPGQDVFPFLRMLETRQSERAELCTGQRWIAVSSDPLADEEGTITGGVWRVSDITESKKIEEELLQAQKAESIAMLAGGIAHDFNNLLTGVIGNASLALYGLAADHPLRSSLEDVMVAAGKAADLTKQLLAYSGGGRFVVRRLDISSAILETAKLLEASIPRKIRLQFDLATEPSMIEADPDQVRQLLMNLVINAAEAIGEAAGTITIRTRSRNFPQGFAELAAGQYVALEVADTGIGMEQSVRSRVFEPFFTTKFLGRGMGLAAVMGIARAHKGTVHVTSQPGQGSVFSVLFPVAVATPSMGAAGEDLTGSGTVLVVDDEEVVRQAAKMALQRYGYKVLLAEDGRAAIEIVRQRTGQIGLVLLDMTMPVMGGDEAFVHLAEIAPRIPVIASTGYSETEAAQRFAGRQLAGFIQKPYTAAQLARLVKAVLKKVGLSSGENP